MIAGSLWLSGILLGIYVTFNIHGNFNEKSIRTKEIKIVQPLKNTVYLDLASDTKDKLVYLDNNEKLVLNNWHISSQNGKIYHYGYPKLKIVAADSSEFEMIVVKSSRGKSIIESSRKADNIEYRIIQQDSVIKLDNYFVIPETDKWRNQKVKIILKVPVGKRIYLSKNLEGIVYDSDDIDETWNPDMVDHFYTMTASGLKCEGCKKDVGIYLD